MTHHNLLPRFVLGQLYVTAAADRELRREDVLAAIGRHCNGDWGNVHPDDAGLNDTALATGGRLLSVYADRKGTKFWIITEANRNVTTVLLPDDY